MVIGFKDAARFAFIVGWELDQVTFDKYHVMFHFHSNRLLNVAHSYGLRSPDGALSYVYKIYGAPEVALVHPILRERVVEVRVASADQLASDRLDTSLSVIHQQIGISGAVYYHVTDSVVFGLDYFRMMARWYGAPKSVLDMDGNPVLADGTLLPGEKQDINFVNLGVTYHW